MIKNKKYQAFWEVHARRFGLHAELLLLWEASLLRLRLLLALHGRLHLRTHHVDLLRWGL